MTIVYSIIVADRIKVSYKFDNIRMCIMITRKMPANLYERRLNRQTRVSKKNCIKENEQE